MSSISSTTPASPIAPPLAPDTSVPLNGKLQVAETEQVTVQSPSYKPSWLASTPGSAITLDSLGIRSPKSSGDLATMLAQASLNLELTIDDSTSKGMFAKAAGILGVMADFNAKVYEEAVEVTTEAASRTSATSTAFASDNANTKYYRDRAPNPPERDRLNYELLTNRSENADREIADLRQQLTHVAANSSEAQAINAAIQSKEGLKTQLVNDAAYFRQELNYYSSEVNKYQGYINAELQKPEKERNNGAIAGWTNTRDYNSGMLNQRRGELESHANNGVAADSQALANKLSAQQGAQGAAETALLTITIAMVYATVAAALAGARDKSSMEASMGSEAGRDLGIENEFEEIMKELVGKSDGSAAALLDLLDVKPIEEKLAARKAERVQEIALGLLASITSFVSSTAQIEPLDIPSPGQQESGSRLRFAV